MPVPYNRSVMAFRVPTTEVEDFYPTPIWAARAGAELVLRVDPTAQVVWEPACGAGHMVHGLRDYFPVVLASDAYPYDGNVIHDFLGDDPPPRRPQWVISNPPFVLGEAFVQRALEVATRGVAMLCRAAFLESEGRYDLHTGSRPLRIFAPFAERVPMHKARWEPDGRSATLYAWFIWTKAARRRAPIEVQIIPPGTRARLAKASDAELFGVRASA